MRWATALLLLLAGVLAAAEPMAATGRNHALYLADDGTVWAWGANGNGQLGLGDTTPRYEPVQVPGLTGVVQVSAGLYHSMALRGDGQVFIWGQNTYGQIGNGSSGSGTDQQVPYNVGLSNVKQIAAGGYHCLVLLTDGTLRSWGYNGTGCVGNATTTSPVTSPVTVVGANRYRFIGGGGLHSLAVRDDGTAWGWGWDTNGQLGNDATLANQSSPVQIAGLSNIVAVAGGYIHSLAVTAGGGFYAWGDDENGQLGDNAALVDQPTPVSVGASVSSRPVVGYQSSIVLRSNGYPSLWGDNSKGQCRQTPNTPVNQSTPYSPGTSLRSISSGFGDFYIAINSDGSVNSWGDNGSGQLGLGGLSPASTGTPQVVHATWPVSKITGVARGQYNAAAVKSDGTAWAWSNNSNGQVGDGSSTLRSTPVQSSGVSGATAISSGGDFGDHVLALDYLGRVYGWGRNSYGQVGDGTNTTPRLSPAIIPSSSGWRSVAAGDDHSLAIDGNGYVKSWGWDTYGQLGDNITLANQYSPVGVVTTNVNNIIQVAAGRGFSAALRADGTVWTWGDDSSGQLGNDAIYSPSPTPVQVAGLTGIVQIAAGAYHMLALRSIGTVAGWGLNDNGQVGDNAPGTNRPTPVSVVAEVLGNLSQVRALGAGATHSFAIKGNGTLRAWGYNGASTYGPLGDGTIIQRDRPTAISLPASLIAVEAGYIGSIAVLSDGRVMAWGYNGSYAIGDGSSTSTTVPAPTSPAWLPQVAVYAAGSSLAASETGPVAGRVRLSRTGSQAGSLTVTYDTAPGGGLGTDFTTGTTVTIPWNQTYGDAYVTPIDDPDVETGDSATVSIAARPDDYQTATPNSAVVTIADNDSAGFLVSSISGNTTEAGGQASFTVRLTSRPKANVTIAINSSNLGEGVVNRSSLTFTYANWSATQAVTVTGVNDAVDDGNIAYTIVTGQASSSDGNYNLLNPADVAVVNIDDDTVGFTISAISGSTTEAGGSATFTVRLNSQPTAPVNLGLSSSNTGEGTVAPTSLTFTASNWSVTQTVTVTGVDDTVDDGDVAYTIITASATSSDGLYNGLNPPDVAVTNLDNDTAAVIVAESGGSSAITEGGSTDTYTVKLATRPLASVTVAVATTDGQSTASPTTLVFTTANWNSPQTVTVTAVDDLIAENSPHAGLVTHGVSVGDGGAYVAGLACPSVNLAITDNDAADFVRAPSSGLIVSEAGSTTTFTLNLATRPTANVTVSLVSNDTTEGTVSPATLYFGATALGAGNGLAPGSQAAWNTPITVTIAGVDDSFDDDNISFAIDLTAASSDVKYSGLVRSVDAKCIDDDAAGVAVVESAGATQVTEAAGASHTDTYTLALTSAPLSGLVQIAIANADGQVTASPANVYFAASAIGSGDGLAAGTARVWNAPFTVTVTGVDDSVAEGAHAGVVTHTVTGAGADYGSMTAPSVTAQVADNDAAGVTVSAISGHTTEAGGSATCTVVLTSQPTAMVTLGVSSSNTGEGTVSPSARYFGAAATGGGTGVDASNLRAWNNPATITATGANDTPPVVDGGIPYAIITAPAVSADPFYSGLNPADVAVINDDDDVAGVTIAESGGSTSVSEAGATDTYTVVLNTQPTGTVTITLTPDAQVTVSPTVLTFTPGNWNSAKTVTVYAVDDPDIEGGHSGTIAHAAAGGGYGAAMIADVTASIVDNDVAGINVSPISGLVTTESGGAATFTVVLATRPQQNVSIALSSDDLTEGDVQPASLTFTSGNWNVPQTVTVTGVDDLVVDNTVAYNIVTAAATSTDADYSGINPSNVAVTNIDNDVPGVTILPLSGLTTSESGAVALFSVRLNTQPDANVSFTLTSSNTTEGTVSPASLTFTSANWNAFQTVTVTGADDVAAPVADGPIAYTIFTGVVTAPGETTGYNTGSLDPPDVSVINLDNDTASVTVTPTGGSTLVSEAGVTDSYGIVLGTKPASGVVAVRVTADSQLQVNGASTATVWFSAAGAGTGDGLTLANAGVWNIAQSITVSAVDDSIAEGFLAATITHQVDAASTATEFLGKSIVSLPVFVIDNDTTGIIVTPTTGLTVTEAGGSATSTVVLTSQPTANVVIGLSSSDATEGAVSPASLTFTAGNWSTPQTVTVTGVNDDVDDGDQAFSIVTGSATSADGNFNGLNATDVAVTCQDDDTALVVLSKAAYTATEGGAGDSYTVRLATLPLASVTVTVTPDAQLTTSPPTLTFTTADWSTPQTVTVSAVDDTVAEGAHAGVVAHSISGGDGGAYSGALSCPSGTATITDNDTAAVQVSKSNLAVSEGGSGDSFTVRLATKPTGLVSLSITPDAQLQVGGSVVYFDATVQGSGSGASPGNAAVWSAPVTVAVTAVDDAVAEGAHSGSLALAASGGGYNAVVVGPVIAAITDNDVAGISVIPTSGLTVTEAGGQAFFAVQLTSQPTASVTIPLSLTAPDGQEIAISPGSLTFTTVNWGQAQLVTITGQDDVVADGNYTATVSTDAATSTDANYSGLDAANISVTNVDNDIRGVTVAQSAGSTAVTEGGTTDTYTIVLDSQPTAAVTIDLLPDSQVAATAPGGGNALHFAPAASGSGDGSSAGNAAAWNTTLTVTVAAVDDAVAESSPHSGGIAHSVSGGDYAGLPVSNIAVTVTDNDNVGIVIGAVSHPVLENGVALVGPLGSLISTTIATTAIQFPGGTDLSALFAGVWLGVTGGVNDGAFVRVATVDDPNDLVTLSDPLTADATSRTITSHFYFLATSATAGTTLDFPAATSLASLQAGQYLQFVNGPNNGITTQIATVDDAGHQLTTTSALTASAGSDAVVFFAGATVVLTSQPTSVVTVPLRSSDTTIATVFPSSLTFTPADWNVPRTIAIAGVNNDIDDGDATAQVVCDPASSPDPAYNGATATAVTLRRIDDDVRGVTVTPTTGLTTTELGGTATFTVVLTSQPTAVVAIPMTSGDADQGSVTPASLTFTPVNWSTAQTVTITGKDGDAVDNGAGTAYSVTLDAIVGASDYAGIDPSDVSLLNLGVNNPPVFDTLNNLTLAEDASPYTVTVTGIDAGQSGEVQTFTVTATSDTPGVVPAPSVTYPGAGGVTEADIVITPVSNASGTATITVTLVDSGGTANGGVDTYVRSFVVTVTPVNDLPQVDLSGPLDGVTGFTSTFTEGLGAVGIVDPTLTVADVDNVLLSSASVTFQGGAPADGALESLAVVTTGTAISASYSSATGQLLLSAGTQQPVADFQTVLRTLRYDNASGAPTTADRIVLVTANDGTSDGPAATATVHVVDVPFAPVLDLNGPVSGIDNTATFTEGGAATQVGTALLDVTDPDSSTINGAVATIANIQDAGSEFLAVDVGASGLSASWTPPTMTITGTASSATYAAVLRTLTYADASQTSTAGVRTIQATVQDGTSNTSGVATASITVVPVNDAPTLTTAGFTISLGQTYTLGAGELAASDIETADPTLLAFVVDLIPGQGNLRRSGVALAIGGTFTQAELLAGQVDYVHTAPVGGSDGFAVRVTDPQGGSSPLRPVIVAITGAAPPVITLGGPALIIGEQAAPTVIDADTATNVADPDSAALNGGNLTATFGGSAQAGDVISIPGVLAGQAVVVGGVQIGILDAVNDGLGGRQLVVSFLADGSATPSRVTTLLKSLSFSTVSDVPPAGTRTLLLTVNDGGVTSAPVGKQVTINPYDDPPVVTPPTHPLVLVPGIALSAVVTATDPEGLALTFALVNPPSQGVLTGLPNASGAFTYTALANASASTDSFRVSVSDGVNTVTYDYPVRIGLVGTPAPLITSLPPMRVNQNKILLTYVPTVSTTGLTAPTLRFVLLGSLLGASFNTSTGAINWPGNPIAAPGDGSGYFRGGILVIDDASDTCGYQPFAIYWTPGGPG